MARRATSFVEEYLKRCAERRQEPYVPFFAHANVGILDADVEFVPEETWQLFVSALRSSHAGSYHCIRLAYGENRGPRHPPKQSKRQVAFATLAAHKGPRPPPVTVLPRLFGGVANQVQLSVGTLAELRLVGLPMESSGAHQLAAALGAATKLRVLQLDQAAIGNSGLAELVPILKWMPGLESVSLKHNGLTPAAAEDLGRLVAGTASTQPWEASLRRRTEEDASSADHRRRLHEPRPSSNGRHRGRLVSISHLNLAGNCMDDRVVARILKEEAARENLLSLDLSETAVGVDAARVLYNGLSAQELSLQFVDLSCTPAAVAFRDVASIHGIRPETPVHVWTFGPVGTRCCLAPASDGETVPLVATQTRDGAPPGESAPQRDDRPAEVTIDAPPQWGAKGAAAASSDWDAAAHASVPTGAEDAKPPLHDRQRREAPAARHHQTSSRRGSAAGDPPTGIGSAAAAERPPNLLHHHAAEAPPSRPHHHQVADPMLLAELATYRNRCEALEASLAAASAAAAHAPYQPHSRAHATQPPTAFPHHHQSPTVSHYPPQHHHHHHPPAAAAQPYLFPVAVPYAVPWHAGCGAVYASPPITVTSGCGGGPQPPPPLASRNTNHQQHPADVHVTTDLCGEEVPRHVDPATAPSSRTLDAVLRARCRIAAAEAASASGGPAPVSLDDLHAGATVGAKSPAAAAGINDSAAEVPVPHAEEEQHEEAHGAFDVANGGAEQPDEGGPVEAKIPRSADPVLQHGAIDRAVRRAVDGAMDGQQRGREELIAAIAAYVSTSLQDAEAVNSEATARIESALASQRDALEAVKARLDEQLSEQEAARARPRKPHSDGVGDSHKIVVIPPQLLSGADREVAAAEAKVTATVSRCIDKVLAELTAACGVAEGQEDSAGTEASPSLAAPQFETVSPASTLRGVGRAKAEAALRKERSTTLSSTVASVNPVVSSSETSHSGDPADAAAVVKDRLTALKW